jgi:GDP-L-fucose synthase
MQGYDGKGIINVGVGENVSIAELAALVQRVVGYEGEIMFDASTSSTAPRASCWTPCVLANLGWGRASDRRTACARLTAGTRKMPTRCVCERVARGGRHAKQHDRSA